MAFSVRLAPSSGLAPLAGSSSRCLVGIAIWTSGAARQLPRPPALVSLRRAVVPSPRRRSLGGIRANAGPNVSVFSRSRAPWSSPWPRSGQSWGTLRQEVLGRRGRRRARGWRAGTCTAFDPIWFGVASVRSPLASVQRRRWTAVARPGRRRSSPRRSSRDRGSSSFATTPVSRRRGLPGLLCRWGGGEPWDALVRLGRYGLWLPSPWLAVALRASGSSPPPRLLVAACAPTRPARRRSPRKDLIIPALYGNDRDLEDWPARPAPRRRCRGGSTTSAPRERSSSSSCATGPGTSSASCRGRTSRPRSGMRPSPRRRSARCGSRARCAKTSARRAATR